MDAYVEVAVRIAKRDGKTAEDVADMGYTEIAALAGVKLGPNGESPDDFFWKNVRTGTVAALQAAEEAAERVEMVLDLEAAQRTYPRLAKFQIYEEDDGLSLR